MSENKKKFDDTDSFWSLDSMLPPTKNPPHNYIGKDTSTTEIIFDSPSEIKTDEEIPKKAYENPILKFETINEYVPENPFIKKVTVKTRNSWVRLNENFINYANLYFKIAGTKSDPVPFVSFIPQYSQMSEEQLSHYFYFRSQARKNIFINTYSPYICLYVYEVINLTDEYTPQQQIDILSSLINAYCASNDALFKNMCNCLCDICLINNLEPPFEKLSHVMSKILECVTLKEFFLYSNSKDLFADSTCIYLINSSSYNYKKSRYYTNETADFFDSNMAQCFSFAVCEISKQDPRLSAENFSESTLTFESFRGALCSNSAKKILTVECICITRSQYIRDTVTNLIKYIENNIRSLLGIKPRLTVNYLSADKKEVVKRYFSKMKKQPEIQKNIVYISPNVSKPEYEKLYEPGDKTFSFMKASEIERASWKTTELLVDAFNEEENVDFTEKTENLQICDNFGQSKSNEISKNSKTTSPQNFLVTAILHASENNFEALRKFALENKIMPDVLIEKINEYALEKIGDIIIETTEDGYIFIDDYASEIRELTDI